MTHIRQGEKRDGVCAFSSIRLRILQATINQSRTQPVSTSGHLSGSRFVADEQEK
jgi:hypothetical protein